MTTRAGPLVIRSMEERDLEPLSRSVLLGHSHIQARWADRLAGRVSMLVAQLDDEVVASVSIEENDDFPGFLHLYGLSVAPPLQNRGIGSAVVGHLEQEAAARGLAGVYMGVGVENVGARRLYERLGYRAEGPLRKSAWVWEGPDGERREIVESVQLMFKRFGEAARSA